MDRIQKRKVRIVLFLLIIFILPCCGGSDHDSDDNGSSDGITNGDGDGNGTADEAPTLTTPYVDSSDISTVALFFSSEHQGLDFAPTGNLKSFQAALSGEIGSVELLQNEMTSNWEVRLTIVFNSTYYVLYAFEPFSMSDADGQTQLSNILVTEGDTVSQGDVIAKLFTSGEGSHVHFGLFKNDDGVCPESYFSEDARSSVMVLIESEDPDRTMCNE